MKAFVTGATGYIGRHLALRLAESGTTVHALCRSPPNAGVLTHNNIVVIVGDITDAASLDAGMKGCAQVFHAAGFVDVWAKDPATYFRVNVEGTRNVLAAAQKHGAEKVVVTSSAGVFGPSNGGPIDETARPTLPLSTDYENSKAAMHQAVRVAATSGLNVVTVCPTRVYGPGPKRHANSVTRMIDLYRRGRWRLLPGTGDQIGNYAYIDDVVDGHLLAMRKAVAGESYILGGDNVSYVQFFDRLKSVSGKDYRLVNVPIPLMMIVAWVQLRAAENFGRQPLITPSWVRRFLLDWAVSSAKAKRELAYAPRSLDEGLSRTLAWLDTTTDF